MKDREGRHSEELNILQIRKWVNSFDLMFKDEKTTDMWHSVMASVLHAAQNSFDNSSPTVKFAWVTVLGSLGVSCRCAL